MKEIRVFEVGFKVNPTDTHYVHKYYVAAGNADEAAEKARAFLQTIPKESFRDKIVETVTDGGKNAVIAASRILSESPQYPYLAKLLDVGRLII